MDPSLRRRLCRRPSPCPSRRPRLRLRRGRDPAGVGCAAPTDSFSRWSLFSAVPLTLSRLLSFESSYPDTADEFNESTGPWTLLIVLPLVAGAGLLAVRRRFPEGLPVAFGLVLGGGLVLVEHATFWIFFFVQNRDSYPVGPAFWSLLVGAAVVAAAGVVVLTRSQLAERGTVRTDWRVACALVVVACVVWFLVSGPEADTVSWWFALYVGTLVLGAAALPITLLWLRSDQRVAALVALTLFALWTLYWAVRELVDPQLGLEPTVLRVEIVSVVLTLLACFAAQAGPSRASARVPSVGAADQ